MKVLFGESKQCTKSFIIQTNQIHHHHYPQIKQALNIHIYIYIHTQIYTMLSATRAYIINDVKSIHLNTNNNIIRSLSSTASSKCEVIEGANAFESLVGNTSLVKLSKASKDTGCNIYGKCEFQNPGGSVKDRAAYWMIKDAESKGILTRGKYGIIVEGTAGNTGIGLALAGSSFGYKTIICIPNTQSEEKKNFLRWAGCHLVEVPAVPFANPNNYVHVAERVAKQLKKSSGIDTFYANQWDNLANRQAHIDSTGPEIWRQTNGKIDAFSCATGTGGTLSGVSKYLKSVNPKVTCALTDPKGAALVRYFNEGKLASQGSSISEGIGQGRLTGLMKDYKPDIALEVGDVEMMQALEDVQRYDGLALGMSSGINIAGAIQVAKRLGPGHTVVTVLCDPGTRYSAKLYNPSFLQSKSLPVFKWLDPTNIAKEAKDLNLEDVIKQATAPQ